MRYLDLDIKTINEKLKNKEIKPIDLVNEAFNRIEETNLNCFITLNKEQALKKAKELEEKEVDNILFGLPIAIKDNIVTKDLRTTAASHILEDFIPIFWKPEDKDEHQQRVDTVLPHCHQYLCVFIEKSDNWGYTL